MCVMRNVLENEKKIAVEPHEGGCGDGGKGGCRVCDKCDKCDKCDWRDAGQDGA